MRRYTVILVLISIILPILTRAQNNAGFLSDNIWYSKDPFFVGDKIRIYSGIFNSSINDIEGNVEFYNNDEPIGQARFLVEGDGNLVRVWVDWEAKKGDSVIFAKIVDAYMPGKQEEKLPALLRNQTVKSERFVDTDIDRDGVGDEQDNDDDGDGVSDDAELVLGTDPKVFNSEKEFERKLNEQPHEDFDNDGIDNDDEMKAGTNPFLQTSAEEYIEAKRDFPSVNNQNNHEIRDKVLKLFPNTIEESIKKADNAVAKTFGEYIQALEQKKQEVRGLISRRNQNVVLPEDKNILWQDAPLFFHYFYVTLLTTLIFSLKTRILIYLTTLFLVYEMIKLYVRKRRKN